MNRRPRQGWLRRLFAAPRLARQIGAHREHENDVARVKGRPREYPPCRACHGDGLRECSCVVQCGRPGCTGRRES